MGLYVSHDAWSGSHSAFHEFRKTLAEHVGIDLMKMEGFRRDGAQGLAWPSFEDEPLVALLDHSDCDGVIEFEKLHDLAHRLWEVAQELRNTATANFVDRVAAHRFAVGCIAAYECGEDLEFS